MTYSEQFSKKFFARLLKPAGNNPQRDRASSFTIVFEELDKMNKNDYTIVETGCMREDHGDLAFGDDGASTYILKTKIDFLYLDSYDIERDNPHPSQLHHVKELCAVIRHLRKGSIICVDDHDAFFTGGKIGKGNYVKEFMEAIGAELLYEGYQIVWKL